jgi:hypothetical protein
MDSVNDYLDAAKSRLGVKADWKLAIELGMSPAWACRVRAGKDLPSDGVMVRIAELANVDPTRAILDLQLWRARDPRVSEIYSSIIQRLGAACIAFALVIVGSYSVQARTITEQTDTNTRNTVYYQKSRRYRLTRILCTPRTLNVQHLTCAIAARWDAPCFPMQFSPA